MLKLKEIKIVESKKELEALPEGKLLINTINAHSYNTALKDDFFAEALMKGDALIPDGASIVMACRKLKAKSQPKERIAGWDLFTMEMERLNRTGVLTGLVLYGIGALLFIPGGRIQSFEFFLLALFVIGCGLTWLETASNPYVTVLGEPEGSERRINLAQSFNGLGWICGPLAGGFFLFAGGGDVTTPYAVLGTLVLLIAVIFSRVKLPEIGQEAEEKGTQDNNTSLWKTASFTVGLLSLFLYVAAQTGINSFFINYATENAGISAQKASVWLSFGGMGLFMAGRMGGSWIMRFVKGEKVLAACAAGALICMVAVILLPGTIGGYFLLLCFLCESIMFPTIFSLSLRHVGTHTKQASSYLIMSIVGGAIAPMLMGFIADHISMAVGFIVPLVCFAEILWFAARYRKL